MFRLFAWLDRQRFALPVLLCSVIGLFVLIIVLQQWDAAEYEATFLQQCRDAGYDAAKCRFFLTASSRAASAEAMRTMLLEAATTSK